MPKNDNEFTIILSQFYQGFSPVAHLNTLTEIGNAGNAASMGNVDVLTPDYINQGPALADLTNGNQDGVVDELINMIMDQAVSNNVTFAIGATKLFKLSSTVVADGSGFPQTITNCTEGSSVINSLGKIYYFFNKSSGGEIGLLTLPNTFDHDWGSTIPSGAAALEDAPHPVAKKEGLIVFGNGQYVGVLDTDGVSLEAQKLDLGAGMEVADITFSANQWHIAVNSGVSGTNRNTSQILLYEAAAVSTLLDDETAVGLVKIGFLMPIGGIIFLAYQDITFAGGYKIGFVSGRKIVDIGHFTGSLPNFQQKTLFKATILFLSSGLIFSAGSVVEEILPGQVSQLADGGLANVGGLAAPFGTPIVASSDGGSNHRLAKFSGFDTACSWRSTIMPLVGDNALGMIDRVTVLTKTLGADARCDIQLEYDQATSDAGDVMQVTGTGKRKFIFDVAGKPIEDFRVFLDWSNGHAVRDCPIRKIIIKGHFVESK